MVSDLASVLGALTRNLSSLTVVAVLLVVATYFILWRTAFGLRLRSCGESPSAAETLGVNVYRYKIIAVLISGAIAGLAGGFIVLVGAGLYQNGITNGRGYIGLAAMIFGNWRPGGLLLGAAAVRLHRRPAAARRRRRRARAADRDRDRAARLRRLPAPQGRAPRRHRDGRRRRAVRALVLHHRRGARRLHPDDAVRRHAVRARVLGATAADARGRRAEVPQAARRADVPDVPQEELDWPRLVEEADRGHAARLRAVLRLPGRVRPALVDDGRLVVGCNVENAAYGVGLCAECGMVSAAARHRRRPADPLVCVNRDGEVIMPCGRCRQLLFENGGPALLLLTVSGVRPMGEVLPDAFGPDCARRA